MDTPDRRSVPPPDAVLGRGTTLGRYVVQRRIGSGGMGSVYEAHDLDLDRAVAIKLLHPSLCDNPAVRERFMREARAAARVRHPNVVEVFDFGIDHDTPFLVMEILQGESLSVLLARESPLTIERAVEVMLPVLSALDAAHRAGVVHRDLKPDNIFMARGHDGSAQPKVLDFGISKLLFADPTGPQITNNDSILGTPHYLSPEQVTHAQAVDARSDQFALGVILYECVSGRRPFSGGHMLALLQSIASGRFPPLRSVAPDVPASFETVVDRALNAFPDARHPTVSALGAALLDFASPADRVRWASCFAPPEPDRPLSLRAPSPRAPSLHPPCAEAVSALLTLRDSVLPRTLAEPLAPEASAPEASAPEASAPEALASRSIEAPTPLAAAHASRRLPLYAGLALSLLLALSGSLARRPSTTSPLPAPSAAAVIPRALPAPPAPLDPSSEPPPPRSVAPPSTAPRAQPARPIRSAAPTARVASRAPRISAPIVANGTNRMPVIE